MGSGKRRSAPFGPVGSTLGPWSWNAHSGVWRSKCDNYRVWRYVRSKWAAEFHGTRLANRAGNRARAIEVCERHAERIARPSGQKMRGSPSTDEQAAARDRIATRLQGFTDAVDQVTTQPPRLAPTPTPPEEIGSGFTAAVARDKLPEQYEVGRAIAESMMHKYTGPVSISVTPVDLWVIPTTGKLWLSRSRYPDHQHACGVRARTLRLITCKPFRRTKDNGAVYFDMPELHVTGNSSIGICEQWARALFPRIPEPGECIEFDVGASEVKPA